MVLVLSRRPRAQMREGLPRAQAERRSHRGEERTGPREGRGARPGERPAGREPAGRQARVREQTGPGEEGAGKPGEGARRPVEGAGAV